MEIENSDVIIDAGGSVAAPGHIDSHAHYLWRLILRRGKILWVTFTVIFMVVSLPVSRRQRYMCQRDGPFDLMA